VEVSAMENRFKIDQLEDRIAPFSYSFFIPKVHINYTYSIGGFTITAVSSAGGTSISLSGSFGGF
jgi:hypothetical protein